MELEQQNAILRELELPIACLVYSGKKSLHAIVRVDAADYNEYRKRVDYLYEVCQKTESTWIHRTGIHRDFPECQECSVVKRNSSS